MKRNGMVLIGVFWIFVVLFIGGGYVNAQQKTDETIVVKKSELPPELVKQLETRQQLGKYSEYIAIGKGVGIAVREGLEAVTDTALKFAQTGPGKLTMFLIAYKVIGSDILQLIIGVPIWFIGLFAIFWSYNKNCIPRQIAVELNENKEPVKFEVVNEGCDKDYEKWAHALVFTVFTIIMAVATLT